MLSWLVAPAGLLILRFCILGTVRCRLSGAGIPATHSFRLWNGFAFYAICIRANQQILCFNCIYFFSKKQGKFTSFTKKYFQIPNVLKDQMVYFRSKKVFDDTTESYFEISLSSCGRMIFSRSDSLDFNAEQIYVFNRLRCVFFPVFMHSMGTKLLYQLTSSENKST